MLRKHAGFAPARQSLLGFRLRSPLPSVEEPCPLSLQTVFEAFSLRLEIWRVQTLNILILMPELSNLRKKKE
jgi:hypothetical protein